MNFRPMLAATCGDTKDIIYPVMCSPKYDGIRCVTLPPVDEIYRSSPVSRSLNPIPNQHVRSMLMKHLPPGLDGELMSDGKFGNVQSAIMSYQGTPDFTYHVFDHIPMWEDPRHHRMILTEYYDRMEMLKKVMRALILPVGLNVIMVNTFMAYNEDELLDFEQDCVMVGYEGICFRSPASPYKFGRSTWNEGWLVKMKRFEDDEATIVGTVELEHNDNDPEKDNLGYTVRTSHQSGMVAGNKLGAFTVVSKNWKESFKVGSGLCQTDREELWKVRESLIGKTIKFKYQPHGTKDRPRTPIFLSFRNSSDM